MSILGLLPHKGGRIAAGSIKFDGLELVGTRGGWGQIRGDRIGMIFQQPSLTLNPAFTVGEQIAETVRRHRDVSRRQAWSQAIAMLERVGIPNPANRARDYPHMFSGGMCQRVMIAQALVCGPQLLIADEPTTALDVTVQANILELLRELQAERDLAVLLITHDLGVIAEMANRVVVMYAGQVVESGFASELLVQPHHPYTRALLGALPTAEKHRFMSVPGTVPDPGTLPRGCRFAPRCSAAVAGRCDTGSPVLEVVEAGWETRCIRAKELYASQSPVAGAVPQ